MTKYNFLPLTLFCITLISFTGCREQTGTKDEEQSQYGSGLIDRAEKAFFQQPGTVLRAISRGWAGLYGHSRTWMFPDMKTPITLSENSIWAVSVSKLWTGIKRIKISGSWLPPGCCTGTNAACIFYFYRMEKWIVCAVLLRQHNNLIAILNFR